MYNLIGRIVDDDRLTGPRIYVSGRWSAGLLVYRINAVPAFYGFVNSLRIPPAPFHRALNFGGQFIACRGLLYPLFCDQPKRNARAIRRRELSIARGRGTD
jgi:hypothetical protein